MHLELRGVNGVCDITAEQAGTPLLLPTTSLAYQQEAVKKALLPVSSPGSPQAAAETCQNGSPLSQTTETLHPSFGLCVLSLEELECY